MEVSEIEDLAKLLDNFLKPSQKLVKYEVRRLTSAGENYGSLMLAVDIHLQENDKDRIIRAVAKKPAPSEFLQKIFQPKIAFHHEIYFYKEIVPCLRNFQQEQGADKLIDCFPEYIASRYNLHQENDEIDTDVILLLENLKIKGFDTGDRTVGFDGQTTLLILDDLAEFHAIPIAMKQIKPEVFNSKIKPLFKPYTMHMSEDGKGPSEVTANILKSDDYCNSVMDKVMAVFNQNELNMAKGKNRYSNEPFGTITHTDLWVNNTMIKFENGKVVKNKLVDFQFIEYSSSAVDVLFFLLTSVQLPVLQEKFDEFLSHYYESFIKNLKKLKCDTAQFSREKFDEELRDAMQCTEFAHCLMMLNPIYAPKDRVRELDKIDEKAFEEMFGGSVPEQQILRSRFIIKTCVDKGWI